MQTLVLVLLGLSGADAAGPGPGMGPCAAIDVRAGEPFTFDGTVVSVGRPDGLSILDADGITHAVRGLGPPWYWRELGVDRPATGDTISVDGRTLDCGAGLENVATRVTVGERTVDLRDPATGLPAWLGGRGRPGA